MSNIFKNTVHNNKDFDIVERVTLQKYSIITKSPTRPKYQS